ASKSRWQGGPTNVADPPPHPARLDRRSPMPVLMAWQQAKPARGSDSLEEVHMPKRFRLVWLLAVLLGSAFLASRQARASSTDLILDTHPSGPGPISIESPVVA